MGLINAFLKDKHISGPSEDFCRFGEDILTSEELTDAAYSAFLSMLVDEWRGPSGFNKHDFNISDIGLIYLIGPYIPCVERVAFTREVDLETDGLPGIRVIADSTEKGYCVSYVRPVKKLPRDIQLIGPCIQLYKYVVLFPADKKNRSNGNLTWFGINKNGRIVSPFDKLSSNPPRLHAASQLYPSLVINAWADSKYLWLVKTEEEFGLNNLRLRFGLSKDHIKSLFYARSLPVTETGRKRPILHWVRAHKRRLKEGIDINIEPYLRGVTEAVMDSLRFEITQPNKEELHGAEPKTVCEAFRLYGPGS